MVAECLGRDFTTVLKEREVEGEVGSELGSEREVGGTIGVDTFDRRH